jgi:hypothetical protein
MSSQELNDNIFQACPLSEIFLGQKICKNLGFFPTEYVL